MKLVLIGIQGAGKSTQGNLLSTSLGIPYLSSGHVFREMSKEKTQLARYLKETLNAGILIPDDMTIKIINEYLSKDEYKKGYILDGFPRTVVQAEKFSNGVDAIIFLDVSDKEALWRISGRVSDREDETLSAIRTRIKSFHTFTQPVVEYYEKQNKLIKIDGEMPVDQIFKDILAKLEMLEGK